MKIIFWEINLENPILPIDLGKFGFEISVGCCFGAPGKCNNLVFLEVVKLQCHR